MEYGGICRRLLWTLYLKYLLVFGKAAVVDHGIRY